MVRFLFSKYSLCLNRSYETDFTTEQFARFESCCDENRSQKLRVILVIHHFAFVCARGKICDACHRVSHQNAGRQSWRQASNSRMSTYRYEQKMRPDGCCDKGVLGVSWRLSTMLGRGENVTAQNGFWRCVTHRPDEQDCSALPTGCHRWRIGSFLYQNLAR